MSQKPSDLARHRFFKAMVVMGSGLALGCGGVSEREGSSGSGDGGTGGNGSDSGGSAGTATSTGGTFSLGGNGGSAGVATGGTGGSTTPTPNCPTSQWTSPNYPECGPDGSGLVLPANSVCDLTRPTSAEDCAPGQTFACLKATATADGALFAPPKPYSCQCVPDATSCREACGDLYSVDARCDETESDPILCGCAIVVLK